LQDTIKTKIAEDLQTSLDVLVNDNWNEYMATKDRVDDCTPTPQPSHEISEVDLSNLLSLSVPSPHPLSVLLGVGYSSMDLGMPKPPSSPLSSSVLGRCSRIPHEIHADHGTLFLP
jgi:hypothetical protein